MDHLPRFTKALFPTPEIVALKKEITNHYNLLVEHEKELIELRRQLKQFKRDHTVFMFLSPDLSIRFFTIVGNYKHLNNVYINSYEDAEKERELEQVIFDEAGKFRLVTLDQTQFCDVVKQGATVVTCGQHLLPMSLT